MSDENWIVRNEENDVINFIYSKEWEKASCWTSCCLGCFFLPAWIIYAILWWKSSVKKQINIHSEDWDITITWDSSFIIKVFNILSDSEVWNLVKENEALIKARKTKMIMNILIVLLVIAFIYIITR
jgi:hypothetical protein